MLDGGWCEEGKSSLESGEICPRLSIVLPGLHFSAFVFVHYASSNNALALTVYTTHHSRRPGARASIFDGGASIVVVHPHAGIVRYNAVQP